MKTQKTLMALMILASIALNMASCQTAFITAQGADLMEGVLPGNAEGKPADEKFVSAMAQFSIELFKRGIKAKENSLVSPLSVMLALSMTANGAKGWTLAQMEKVLGGGISLSELNKYLYAYVKGLPSEEKSKLNIANSIWFRDAETLSVRADFLQKNADYYNANAYKSAFDAGTADGINAWVKSNTDGMIEKIVEQIPDDVMLYLINAVAFDAEWEEIYKEHGVYEGEFADINGNRQKVDFMASTEHRYLDDGKATGFLKPYAGGGYSFAALLPGEGVDIGEYIQSLTGGGFVETMKNAESAVVYASMPKFGYEYGIEMNDALKALGMPDAFDEKKADFSKMASSSDGNIYIGSVVHKTFISVTERGTRAGAATKVAMAAGGAPMEPKYVRLDRPFVFAIIDNATKLPVFIGTLMSV